jgi:hypothetical protein
VVQDHIKATCSEPETKAVCPKPSGSQTLSILCSFNFNLRIRRLFLFWLSLSTSMQVLLKLGLRIGQETLPGSKHLSIICGTNEAFHLDIFADLGGRPCPRCPVRQHSHSWSPRTLACGTSASQHSWFSVRFPELYVGLEILKLFASTYLNDISNLLSWGDVPVYYNGDPDPCGLLKWIVPHVNPQERIAEMVASMLRLGTDPELRPSFRQTSMYPAAPT